MSYTVYKFIHIIGLSAVFMALGGAIIGAAVAGQKPAVTAKLVAITHGIGMVLMLLGGFGMLARLQIHWPWPWWIVVKVLLWLILGAGLTLSYRSKSAPIKKFLALLSIVLLGAGVVLFR